MSEDMEHQEFWEHAEKPAPITHFAVGEMPFRIGDRFHVTDPLHPERNGEYVLIRTSAFGQTTLKRIG